jgi:hypothetical protein
VQSLLHVDQLFRLALEQTVDRDSGPACDHHRDVVLVHLFLDHRVLGLSAVAFGELAFQRRQLAVANLRGAVEVAAALRAFVLHAQRVDSLRDVLDAVERLLLLRPACGQAGVALLRLGELALDRLAHVLRLFLHRGELDLELAHAAIRFVELDRARVDLHPQA